MIGGQQPRERVEHPSAVVARAGDGRGEVCDKDNVSGWYFRWQLHRVSISVPSPSLGAAGVLGSAWA